MAVGPGKYDAICTYVREASRADAAIVVVFNGKFGHGFSMQATAEVDGRALAKTLETIAQQIRADYERMMEQRNG